MTTTQPYTFSSSPLYPTTTTPSPATVQQIENNTLPPFLELTEEDVMSADKLILRKHAECIMILTGQEKTLVLQLIKNTINRLKTCPVKDWHGSGYTTPVMELSVADDFAQSAPVDQFNWRQILSPSNLKGKAYVTSKCLLGLGYFISTNLQTDGKLTLSCSVIDPDFTRTSTISNFPGW
jgi:hypothetical protein